MSSYALLYFLSTSSLWSHPGEPCYATPKIQPAESSCPTHWRAGTSITSGDVDYDYDADDYDDYDDYVEYDDYDVRVVADVDDDVDDTIW